MKIDSHSLASIREKYEEGKYLQAYHAAEQLAPLRKWTGGAARIVAGRLAWQLGAPRLANYHLLQAYREDSTDAEAKYYYGHYILMRRGPYAAWQFLKRVGDLSDESVDNRTLWYTLHSQVASQLRDFETAESWLERARSLDTESPWVLYSQALIRQDEDRYQEAYELLLQALALRPWYRSAIQAAGHLLTLLDRDEEALALLQEADQHLESSAVVAQMIDLQIELQHYTEARQSIERLSHLMPLMEKNVAQQVAARQSNIAYFLNYVEDAINFARQAGHPFYDKIADHLAQSAPEAGHRTVLPVGFVRQHHMTCGPATLSALSRYWSMPADHLQIAEEICYNGTTAYNERRWAEENGWYVREFTVTETSARALIDAGIPFTLATVDLGNAHLQAVVGYDSWRKTMLIRDPFSRYTREALTTELLKQYAATGPRGMALVPANQKEKLQSVALPDTPLWDFLHQIDGALETHQRTEAAALVKRMETAAPEHHLVLEARTRLAIYDGNPISMLAAVESLLAFYPDDDRLQLTRLSYLRDLTRRVDLLESYRQLCQRKDAHPIFWQEYARELSQDARTHDQAAKLLQRTIRIWPTKESTYHLWADVCWTQGHFADALELYRFAACLNDKNEALIQSYFIACHLQQQTDLALAFLQYRQRRLSRQSHLPSQTLIWAYQQIGQWSNALQVLEEALVRWPDEGDMLLFAADVLFHAASRYWERATSLLEQAADKAKPADWLRTSAFFATMKAELPEALQLWQKVLALQPLAIDAHDAVVNLLEKMQGREAALAHISQAVDRFPHHHPLHRLWLLWLGNEPPAVAEPIFRRVVDMDLSDAWARRQYSYWLANQRRYEDAWAVAQSAYELDPTHPDYHHLHGILLRQRGQREEAKEAFSQSIRLATNIDPFIANLLDCCISADERHEALAFVRQQLMDKVILGEGMLRYRAHAERLLGAKELLTQLRESLAARPELWQMWSACILQFLAVNRPGQALHLAQKATQRFPLIPRLWLDLARVYKVRLNGEGEQEALTTAYEINPRWSVTILRLCDLHERRREWAESRALLEQVLAFDPLNGEYLVLMAEALWHLGERETALERIRYALTLDPDQDRGWFALRKWSQEVDRIEQVAETAREIATLRPHEALSWFNLARALEEPEHAEESLQALEKAITYNPRFIPAYELQVGTLLKLGRVDEARQACNPTAWKGKVPIELKILAARIEGQTGDATKATEMMRQALSEDPNYYQGWQTLADWYRRMDAPDLYLQAAETMAQLRPHSEISLGYLGEAKLLNNDVQGAGKAFRRAYDIEPRYHFAGFYLFDLLLKFENLNGAQEILTRLQQHTEGPLVTARAVQLAAKQRDREAARDGLLEICVTPSESEWPLQAAADAMMRAGWGQAVIGTLDEALELPEAQSQVGAEWMHQRAFAESWPSATKLRELVNRGEIGDQALYAFLVALAKQNKSKELHLFLKQNETWLRDKTFNWGSGGHALALINDQPAVVHWMSDWPAHPEAEPWMLLSLTEALHFVGRSEEANRVSRQALTRPQDHTSRYHQLWLALGDLLAGEPTLAQQCVREINPQTLPPKFLFLFHLLRAVMLAGQMEPASKAQDIKEARLQIKTALKSFKVWHKNNRARLRIYRACLKQIADSSNEGFEAQVWRWRYHFFPEAIALFST